MILAVNNSGFVMLREVSYLCKGDNSTPFGKPTEKNGYKQTGLTKNTIFISRIYTAILQYECLWANKWLLLNRDSHLKLYNCV